jgi:4-hydroxybenzoate polyprenyltransferase
VSTGIGYYNAACGLANVPSHKRQIQDCAMGTETPSLARALWVLARPRLIPFVLLLPVVGFGWGHWDRALDLRGAGGLPLVVVAWLLLQCATMWLNAALDRDSGEVLWGRAIAVPRETSFVAYVALVLAVALASIANLISGAACAACATLAVLYSHPATAWKGHAFLGPLVNILGYGLLSTLAGWALVGVPQDTRTILVWPLGAFGLLGCYFAVQAFQADEDRARGYRTLVATHGPRAVLLAARLCIGVGFVGGVLLAVFGWLPRLCLVGFGLWVWIDRYLAKWSRQPGGGDERWARGLALRLLVAALCAITLAYTDFFIDMYRHQPVCGLGTAAGHPPDAAVYHPYPP